MALRVASYAAAGLLVLALIGLAAGLSSGNASVVRWLWVLLSAALLVGIAFFTRGVPGRRVGVRCGRPRMVEMCG